MGDPGHAATGKPLSSATAVTMLACNSDDLFLFLLTASFCYSVTIEELLPELLSPELHTSTRHKPPDLGAAAGARTQLIEFVIASYAQLTCALRLILTATGYRVPTMFSR